MKTLYWRSAAHLLAIGLLQLLALGAQATVRLPAVVGSHMVLQRDRPVRVWGWAAADEPVQLTFRGCTYQARAATTDGRWQLTLPATPAGGPYTLVVQGASGPAQVLDDVLFGDVWLAAGQSNMQFKVKDGNPGGYQPVQHADQEIAAATYPQLRLLTVPQHLAYRPQTTLPAARWQVCSPATVAEFSAVAYFFGRDLHTRLRVPIGLLVSSWGGTPAEAWVSAPGLQPFPEFEPALADFARRTTLLAADQQAYEAARRLAGEGRPAAEPPYPGGGQLAPSALYNAMIAPLLPLSLTGVIWYQGETNVGRAAQYRRLLPALITDWRRGFGQADLPFLLVQLANYQPRAPQPGPSRWAELREAQAAALALPRTGLATAIDLGLADDIHPPNKQEVGRRLALAAGRVAYADTRTPASGPQYQSHTRHGGTLRVRFTQLAGGLVMRGDTLRGFAVAGADRQFHWATARIVGRSVELRCPLVPQPVAVRYNWADNPGGTLYNRAGLPALPFRTDDWPE